WFYAYVVDGIALGMGSFMRADPAHGVIELGGILVSPAMQQTRASTEATYLFMQHAFETLGCRRFEWKCNDLNAPSIVAAKRFGFTYEGTFRQHMVVKGYNRDTAWFSIIDGEWPRIKAGFEAWLDPANFDAQGRQKAKLQVS
ncbi:MAG: GNAT family N-acetyltransferase, partial [Alphaproteobacteria bacterium]|nr:GNAT family N-acetyltransferase [Alphaproteobacteria bacterium]